MAADSPFITGALDGRCRDCRAQIPGKYTRCARCAFAERERAATSPESSLDAMLKAAGVRDRRGRGGAR